MAQRNVSHGMGQDGGQLGIVARQQWTRNENRAARHRNSLVELEPAPVCRKRRRGRRVLGWLAAVENEEAIVELWAMSRQAVADLVKARFGGRSDVGLQLRGEPLTHPSVILGRIVIVRGVGLLRERHGGSGQEEKALHRYSVRQEDAPNCSDHCYQRGIACKTLVNRLKLSVKLPRE